MPLVLIVPMFWSSARMFSIWPLLAPAGERAIRAQYGLDRFADS